MTRTKYFIAMIACLTGSAGNGAEGEHPQHIEYPEPAALVVGFADGESLSVYSGEVSVVATFRQGTFARRSRIEGSVIAQACNDEICLPPSKFPVSLDVSADARADPTENDAAEAP